jgi:WD40 repeat protein
MESREGKMKKASLCICMAAVCVLLVAGSMFCDAVAGERAWLGIEVKQVTGKNMRMLHMQYGRWQVVFVSEVFKGGPAEQMGIRPDDVILSANYKDITNPGQLAEAVSQLNPGDKIVLLVSRAKEKAQYISGTLGKTPAAGLATETAEPGSRPSGRGGRTNAAPGFGTAAVPTAAPAVTPAAHDGPAKIFAPTGHHRIISLELSADGRYILSGGDEMNSLKLWDIATGREAATLTGHKEPRTQSVAFSPDGKYALSGSFDKTVKLWDVATGKEIHTFTGHSMMILCVAFSPDGKYAASGSRDKTIKLWDAASGREVRTFSGTFSGHSDGVASIAFSPDGKYLLSGSYDKTVKLWEVATGSLVRTFTGHTWQVSSVAFSPDGKRAFSRAGDRIVKIWDVASGSNIRTISVDDVDAAGKPTASQMVVSGNFSPDGRRMSTTNRLGNINLWDMETGKPFKTLRGHIGYVQHEVFSKDMKRVVSGGYDGTIRIWDIQSGREIAQFISLKDGEWIVLTTEGYYNSSLNAHKYLNIRLGNKVYSIEQFYDVFYRPDIVAAKLRGDDIGGLITLTLDEAIKNPPPAVEVAPMTAGTGQPKVKVCYTVKSTGGGIGEVRVFHNGKLVQSDGYYREAARGPAGTAQLASSNSASIYAQMRSINIKAGADAAPIASRSKGNFFEDCMDIDAVAGENEVSVSAFNGTNSVQSFMQTVHFKSAVQPRDPHLYILSIGIDQYKDSSVNLKYAVKDAKDLEEKINRQSMTLYRPENIHFSLITDNDATKENILNKVSNLSAAIQPQDSFILFVAGHGVLLQNQYYMLTHEFNGQVHDASMISSNEIVEMSKKIKSLSQLLIFDTCHAGGVDTIISGLYDARMSVLAKKMGLHIYASASDKQTALDGYRGNGLFTHTLLDGLNNNRQADKNQDGRVTVAGLGDYAKRRTAEISKQIGHAQTPLIINFGRDSALYRLR